MSTRQQLPIVRRVLVGCLLWPWLVASSIGQPANDMFSGRIVLTGTNLTVNGNNYAASTEPGEFTGVGGEVILYTVWYSWTAPASGFVHFTKSSPVYDVSVSLNLWVYQGNSIDTLALLTPTNGGSAIIMTNGETALAVTNGQTLQIRVGTDYYPTP